MKKIQMTSFLVMILFGALGQSNETFEYFSLIKKADSLYRVNDYKSSAINYSSAFKSFGGKGYANHRYNAACSWSLAGFPDSAFFQLEKIANEANFSDYRHLTTDSDLKILHNDYRWNLLLKLVLKNKEKKEANFDKPLLHLMDSLVTEDQKWRNYLTKSDNKELKYDTISRDFIISKMASTDSMNYFFLKNILNKYCFPNYDLIGQEGSHNFWLLVQHQDSKPNFQDSVLSKMKIEVDKKKASGIDYAYLMDRVKVNTGQLQIYGTQMQLNIDSTSYEPKPVIEPDKLNERRKSVGLNNIEEYIEIMNKRYFGSLKRK